jgi:RNA polymerase sigma-70 factor (ECF subfamily)
VGRPHALPRPLDGTAGSWLFAIARKVLVSSVRRGWLERTACARLGLPVEAATEPDGSWLDGLDEALDELAYDDVARELGTSTEAARVRVHRGLQTLRLRLRQRMETP